MVPKHVAVTLCRHRYRSVRSLGAHRVLRALGAPVHEEVEEEEDALDGIPEDGDETWERNATKASNRGPGRNLKEKAVTQLLEDAWEPPKKSAVAAREKTTENREDLGVREERSQSGGDPRPCLEGLEELLSTWA